MRDVLGTVRAFAERRREQLVIVWLALVLLGALPAQGWLRGDSLFYAAVMKSTLASGDWMTLRFGAEPYFYKPPLHFWYGAAVMAVLGANMFAVNVISLVPTLGLLLAFRALARRLVDGTTAFLATVVLATSSVLVRNGGVPRLDAALTLSMVAAVAAVVAGETRPRLRPLFWVAVGIGVGIKGPGAFLPVAVVALWSILRRRASPWNDPWFWAGLPASVAFAAPWFVANDLRYPGVFRQAYLHDDLEATLVGNQTTTSPLRKYATDFVREWWPWIPFMVHGAFLAVGRCVKGERDGPAPLAVAWTLAVAASVLSIGNAYSRYLFPALPAASVFAAWSLLRIWPRIARWDLVRVVGCLAAAGTALIAFGPVQPHGDEVPDVVLFEPSLRTQGASDPVLWLGEKVPRSLQSAAILYVDTVVRPVPPDEVRARLVSGAPCVVALLPHEDGAVPDGVAARALIRGRESDLVELTLRDRD